MSDWDAAPFEPASLDYLQQFNAAGKNLGKIEGLPSNPYRPEDSGIPYNQGAFYYNGYYGQPVWEQGSIIGYEFVQHDAAPGMMSVFRTDLSGNIAQTQLSPEGEDISFSDVISMAAPYVALAFPALGAAIGSALGASGIAATAIGNAVIGGVMSEASGGDFLQGALTSGAGSLLGGVVNPAVTEAVGSQAIGNALTSGALAELQGGDFAQGALSGALSGAVSDAKLALAEDYINSIAPGTSYEADLPTSQDVLDVIAAEQPSYQVSDTAFTPDYSLNVGAPVVQDMGAQGIQAPTINEVIDVVNQPVDYSLPVPETNFELVMPTAPNIDAMGGGQGITVPVSGGTLTESGVIPDAYIPVLGDVASFINQPAPDSGVTTQEPAQVTDDISGKLAALNVANALVPIAVGSLLANKVGSNQAGSSGSSGYEIVPVPGSWKSPTYNQQFTPSAPIDFGSPELLKGTQWESPLDISQVINTINSQSFQQQPMVLPDFMSTFQGAPTIGATDIIGELGGKPVSIADIIAGIQSGQTYPSTMG